MKDVSPFPKRLKIARKAAGLSQKKLGILAGIDEFSSSARMNQYEKGTHSPDYSMVQRIGSVLELPVAYFYAEDDGLAELIELYEKLNKSKRTELINVVADHY